MRPDLAPSRKLVSVDIISHKDLIDINTKSAVTKVYLQVSLNGTNIDFYAQNDFDAQRLIDQLNYQNENSSLYVLKSNQLYSKNYFFTLISSTRVRRQHYELLERRIADVFVTTYKQFADRNVTVLTTWQEEYVDESRRIWFGLSVLVSVDNQPVDELITVDRNIFGQVAALTINKEVSYSFRLPKLTPDEYLHPLAKAFTFFSNILICRRDFDKIETLIKRTVEDYRPGRYFCLKIFPVFNLIRVL